LSIHEGGEHGRRRGGRCDGGDGVERHNATPGVLHGLSLAEHRPGPPPRWQYPRRGGGQGDLEARWEGEGEDELPLHPPLPPNPPAAFPPDHPVPVHAPVGGCRDKKRKTPRRVRDILNDRESVAEARHRPCSTVLAKMARAVRVETAVSMGALGGKWMVGKGCGDLTG